MRLCSCLLLCLALAPPSPAGAQSSRRDLLEAQRARKARDATPPEPGRLESLLLRMEETRLLERIFSPYEGWYPKFGGQVKGAGFSPGGGYKARFWRDRALFNAWGVHSLSGYRTAVAELTVPQLADERVSVGVHARYRHHPREQFYGLGQASLKADRTSYLREESELAASVTARPRAALAIGAEFSRQTEDIGAGNGPGYPSIEERFTAADAPGLLTQPAYLKTRLFADVDYRDQPGNTRSGGRYRVAWTDWNDRDGTAFSFRHLFLEAIQAFPIFDKKRVFIVRARAENAYTSGANQVPFYLQPTIGGSQTLRGFREYRFRDRAILLLNGEYRWEAFSGLDMALFADWGEVAPDWESLTFNELKTAYGIGFRFNTFKSVFLRIDLGRSRQEGLRVNTSFSGAF